MGSFNTTCFVTNQTIKPGDEVVIIPIVNNIQNVQEGFITRDDIHIKCLTHSSYTTHPDCFWKQYSPVLYGEYSDYGRFNLKETDENRAHIDILLSKIRNQLLFGVSDLWTFTQIENEHSQGINVFFDFFIDKCRQFKLCIFNQQLMRLNSAVMLNVAVMHKCVYDYLVKHAEQFLNKKKSCSTHKMLFDLLSKELFTEKSFWEDFTNENEKKKTLAVDVIRANIFLNVFRFGMNSELVDVYDLYGDKFTECLSTPQTDCDSYINAILSFCDEYIKNTLMFNGLEFLNLHYKPYVYAPQDYDNSIGKEFLKLVTKTSKHLALLNN